MKTRKMKQMVLGLAISASMVALTACGGDESNTQQGNTVVEASSENVEAVVNEQEREQDSNQTTEEISIENLMNHAETSSEDFDYYTQDGKAYIYGYRGEDSIVVIPESIEDCPVISVKSMNGSGIRAIKFSDSVEVIESKCFCVDEDLEYVIFGANVKTVGDRAFAMCKSMKEIQMNDTLQTIEEGALATRSLNIADIYIPESVTSIGAGAFEMNDNQTIYVKAGSYAETYCIESSKSFDKLKYVVE